MANQRIMLEVFGIEPYVFDEDRNKTLWIMDALRKHEWTLFLKVFCQKHWLGYILGLGLKFTPLSAKVREITEYL